MLPRLAIPVEDAEVTAPERQPCPAGAWLPPVTDPAVTARPIPFQRGGEEARRPPRPEERMLIVFAGEPKVGDLRHAAEEFGVAADAVDVAGGGRLHDVLRDTVFDALLEAVMRQSYTVVWLAPPCSSFSVLHIGRGRAAFRTRTDPEGVPGLGEEEAAYVSKHNELAKRAAALAMAAFMVGATYVIENPVDRGMRRSPHFSRRFRRHVPIWLLPVVRRLARETGPAWVSFAQCAFRGEFQKLTTLMAAGPRAAQLRALEWATCEHDHHVRRARGRAASGASEAAEAAAYPPLFNAAVTAILFRAPSGDAVQSACASDTASALLSSIFREREANARASQAFLREQSMALRGDGGERWLPKCAVDGTPPWRAAPHAMPPAWPESSDWDGSAARQAAASELRYISRRRAEAEPDERLCRETLPAPTRPPRLNAQPLNIDTSWPDGAPPPPVAISQLFKPGIYAELSRTVRELASHLRHAEDSVQRGESPQCIKGAVPVVYEAEQCQPAWARSTIWDTRDPDNCVPVRPFSEDDPPEHDLNPAFFAEWGERLEWPDEDMIHRATQEGGSSRSACRRDTVIHAHHLGLRQHYGVARSSVEADTAEGWISSGTSHLQFVPSRLVPKNVVEQSKWRLDEGGVARRVTKWRVTTDDSIAAAGTDSRNTEIDRGDINNVSLPRIQQLARAVAIVRAAAAREGVHVPGGRLREVALWALDLTSAYRRVAAGRHEWWQQCFVWHDGVRLDKRCVFGSAHLVDLFQRISTFVMAVARERIKKYDRAHPYSDMREAWRRRRAREAKDDRCTFSDIYLDDGFGLTCTDGEPLRGPPPGSPPVKLELEVGGLASESGHTRCSLGRRFTSRL